MHTVTHCPGAATLSRIIIRGHPSAVAPPALLSPPLSLRRYAVCAVSASLCQGLCLCVCACACVCVCVLCVCVIECSLMSANEYWRATPVVRWVWSLAIGPRHNPRLCAKSVGCTYPYAEHQPALIFSPQECWRF